MAKQKHFWGSLSILLFSILGLGGLAYLGSYTRFMADDYCSAYYAQHFGLLRSIWYWYINWSGRYTAFAFDWLVLVQTLGPYGAHLFPPLAIGTWTIANVVAIYLSLKRLSLSSSTWSLAAMLGTSFTLMAIVLSPDIAQSFFWLNGVRSYSLPLVIASICVCLFQGIVPRLRPEKAVWWLCALAILLTFFNGGFSETYAVMQLMLLAFLVCLHWLYGGRKSDAVAKILASASLGALASVIIMILAPGNAVRQLTAPPPPSLFQWMEISAESYQSFLQNLLLTPQKISAMAGALLASIWAGIGHEGQINLKRWSIPVQVLGGIFLSFICILPSVYGYVEAPPPRTLSIAVFALTALWMNASFLIGGWLGKYVRFKSKLQTGLLVLASLSIALASVLTLSYVHQNQDAYIAFAQKWDITDAQILQARAQHLQSVTIPSMDNWAMVERPSDNQKFWATKCYSQYYGIQVFGPPY